MERDAGKINERVYLIIKYDYYVETSLIPVKTALCSNFYLHLNCTIYYVYTATLLLNKNESNHVFLTSI